VWNPEFHTNCPALWDRTAGVELAARQLNEAYDLGVRTIVDMTVLGQGRDLGLISQVAERTRVNIVLATGVGGAGAELVEHEPVLRRQVAAGGGQSVRRRVTGQPEEMRAFQAVEAERAGQGVEPLR
jgi:hypothetical protein